MPRRISLYTRQKILNHYLHNKKDLKQALLSNGLSKTTFYRILKRFKSTGTVKTRCELTGIRKPKKRKLGIIGMYIIWNKLQSSTTTTLREYQEELARNGIVVGRTTIHNYIRRKNANHTFKKISKVIIIYQNIYNICYNKIKYIQYLL